MSDFKFWGWDKKPRTMLRFVKPGDIFCFQLESDTYGFGRIISKITTGHVAEIFDITSKTPTINSSEIISATRKLPPIILDTYSLFDKKIEKGSDWRVIGNQKDYIPTNVDDIYFTFGVDDSCKKKDIFDNTYSISQEESTKYPRLSPFGDYDIKKLLGAI
ncbi:hypothetical protein AHYW_002445 [Providencia manganoxydans]|uniref:immunity 26/phosphotriesterase HocA family protein n=1 Tax=Providencia manganoxydans TaxID=2923283 RepID=UPI0038F93914